jgi:hypothetical protein
MQPIVSVEPLVRTPGPSSEPAKDRSSAAKRAWDKRRKNEAVKASQRTDKWTETLCRALTARVAKRWRFVSFRGKNDGEWYGAVDILAIRKDTSKPDDPRLKRGDRFEMILVLMKGGGAREPDAETIQRLRAVQELYRAKEIVLFRWNRGEESSFSKLADDDTWKKCSVKAIFG